MNLVTALLSFLLFSGVPNALLVVDKDLKKPPSFTNDFTPQLYLQRTFPVYAAEVNALVKSTDEAVKWMDKEQGCESGATLTAGHTAIRIEVRCRAYRTVTITLLTTIEEASTSYSFPLVKEEADLRKAQRRMLDFATYLTP